MIDDFTNYMNGTADPSTAECEVCGQPAVRYWYGGELWICAECDLPDGQMIGQVEREVWAALLKMKASMRRLEPLCGQKIAVWFVERYRRLGLH